MLDLDALEKLDDGLPEVRDDIAPAPVAAPVAARAEPVCPHLARMAAE
ncbi:MAG: hypothetical protein AAGH68_08340 [Pseudomonadota bacterium]